MKKIFLISLVVIMLAATTVPALAGNGPSNGNGNGNGNSPGQGTGAGNQDQDRERDKERDQDQERDQLREHEQERERDRERSSNPGVGRMKNQENHHWMYTPFYLQGVITTVDTGAGTITVALWHGNAKVKEFIGSELTITVNADTQIFQLTQGGDDNDGGEASESVSDDGDPSNRVPITFDQLAVDQRVAIHGRLVEEAYTARLITVYIQAPPITSDTP
jgi:hypothetical protein